jgi:hypothetical protein
MKRTRLTLLLTFAATAVLFYSLPATSWVPETSPSVRLKWPGAVSWVVNPAHGTNITGAKSVTAVITDAFAQWTGAPNTAIPIGSIGTTTTSTTVSSNDGQNLICFTCTVSGGFGKDTIAVTLTAFQSSGVMVDADMVFNTANTFITDPVAATGNDESLQTVATHEFGHFLGLDHSAVVRSIMNPFAPPLLLTLSYDDLAGISTTYPAPGFTPITISGTVRNGANVPVFGAHVFAESTTNTLSFPAPTPTSGVRKSPIGTISNADGTYSISGVPQDSYTVTAEPLDGPVNNTNFGGSPAFATNFTTRQH